jgi:CheY-like chemotaxis protein
MATVHLPLLPVSAHATKSLRIFVVENHADTLQSLRLYLEDLGHEVTAARNVKEALEKLPGSGVEVLLSDIGLPDGTGWELLEKAGLSPDVFTIAMSGFGMGADSERSFRAGYRHHLLKPFRSDELDSVLEEAKEMLS